MVDSTDRKRAYVVFLPNPWDSNKYELLPYERNIPDHKCLVYFMNFTGLDLNIEFKKGMTKYRTYLVKPGGVPATVNMTKAFGDDESTGYEIKGGIRSGDPSGPRGPRIVIPRKDDDGTDEPPC